MSSPETAARAAIPGAAAAVAAPSAHCVRCGAVLPPGHGIAPCPQCHAPTVLALRDLARVDAGGTICCDVACRQCGYNLRGLRPDGRCPECATPIGVSMRGDLLRFSEPRWLRRLARGARLAFWGIVAGLATGCLVPAAASSAAGPAASAVALLAGLLGVYGVWLLTSPDPAQGGEVGLLTLRKLVRAALLVGLAVGIAEVVVSAAADGAPLQKAKWTLVLVSALVSVAGWFAELTYLARLALRIPEPAAARSTRAGRWVCAAAALTLLTGGVLVAVDPSINGTAGMTGVALLLIAGLLLLSLGIWYLTLLWRLSILFDAQAEAADLLWARVPAPAAAAQDQPAAWPY